MARGRRVTKINREHPALGVRRESYSPLAGYSFTLRVSLILQKQKYVFIFLQLYPTGDNLYLPPHLQLSLLNECGDSLLDIDSRSTDTCLQIQLSGLVGEKFSLKIALEKAMLRERFII